MLSQITYNVYTIYIIIIKYCLFLLIYILILFFILFQYLKNNILIFIFEIVFHISRILKNNSHVSFYFDSYIKIITNLCILSHFINKY